MGSGRSPFAKGEDAATNDVGIGPDRMGSGRSPFAKGARPRRMWDGRERAMRITNCEWSSSESSRTFSPAEFDKPNLCAEAPRVRSVASSGDEHYPDFRYYAEFLVHFAPRQLGERRTP